ncbi:carbohydrate-binding protein, partial [Francisella tularensis]|uniref:carbohydrate-binding protein n=1 Tax=Francisella tularensis TaxID=263 RepID=UPI0023AE6300|nr:chitinase [Francisella tularensis subsp. holarctica]
LKNLDKCTRYTIEVIASKSNASREDSITFETIGADYQNNDQNNDQNNNAGSTGNWNAESVYNKGDKVLVNGETYEDQWLTQGNNPA